MSVLRISNLPHGISNEQIKSALNKIGSIITVEVVRRYFKSTLFDLGLAYVRFDKGNAFDYFIDKPPEIIIDGYFCQVSELSDPKFLSLGFILGIEEDISEKDLYLGLMLSSDINIQIQRPVDKYHNTFASIQFPTPESCKSFILYNNSFNIKNCQVQLITCPLFSTHVFSISPHQFQNQHFQRLKNLPRFQDFSIICGSLQFHISSIIIYANSNIIRPPILSIEIDLSEYEKEIHDVSLIFNSLIDFLYGCPIVISDENSSIFHFLSCKLGLISLIKLSGANLMSTLSVKTAPSTALVLFQKKLNYDYVVDFIAAHIEEYQNKINNESIFTLPTPILKAIAKHPLISETSYGILRKVFRDAIITNKISENDISNPDNINLDVNSNRQMLLSFVQKKKLHPLQIRNRDPNEIIPDQEPDLISSIEQNEEINETHISETYIDSDESTITDYF